MVFANDGGLGAQTRRLAYMLKPYRILLIDSSDFSKNTEQHFEWYDGFTGYRVKGFPSNYEIKKFMQGLTHVLVCENPLNLSLLSRAQREGIKVFIQSNYEFCDHLDKDLPLPHKFLMPSYWKIAEMKERFGDDKVEYLPPPIDPNEFKDAREENFSRQGKPRLLHIVGTLAAKDRNGTLDLLESLAHIDNDFELVIRSQHELPSEYMTNDRRVRYVIENTPNAYDMYKDFDAMILPRRYGGLSLGCNEALMSGLPVIMLNISPNNRLLPQDWLVEPMIGGEFYTRIMLEYYAVNPVALAEKIQWLLRQDLNKLKSEAFEIGYNEFSPAVLKPKYEELFT